MLVACSSKHIPLTSPSPSYRAGLLAAEAAHPAGWAPYGPEEQAAVESIISFFSAYTPEALAENTPGVYATDLFFRDGFREIQDLETLTNYFVHSAGALRFCTFEFQPHASVNGNVYLPWTMRFSLKRDKEGKVSEVLGMSHLRFNTDGKVVFHQDYWDPTDVLWRRIPIAGWMIQKIRNRL